jgi:UDP-N-acetylmuramoyl-L-alanyl-D-glutamate--2,6-diaminopimelate ligase
VKGRIVPTFTLLNPSHPQGADLAHLVLGDIRLVHGDPRTRVTSVAVNSSEVQPGGLFAALPGRNGHGALHARRAAAAGAGAVLTDADGMSEALSTGLPLLIVDDPRAELGRIAAAIYGTDRTRPFLFGVTGTNGKTTTVHLIDAILTQLGISSGHSSTVDRRSGRASVASRLTSPEASEMHALLARMVEDGVEAAALEVSAQALSRRRVDGIRFDVAGFTNLSHDHMDDYPSTEEYLAAKLSLFSPARADQGVVLLDSPAGLEVRDRAQIPITTVSSLPSVAADWTVRILEVTPTTTRFEMSDSGGRKLTTTVPLVGRHMAADCALALAMVIAAGHSFTDVCRSVAGGVAVTVPGRTDLVSGPRGPRVYTDFSHTPDSVSKTLSAMRDVASGKVLVVIGGDGDRDPTKRVPMGRAAATGADVVIITDHHPRFENPSAIRSALLAGARAAGSSAVIMEMPQPAQAIREAVRRADAGDVILWVGPGQTDYRDVRGEDIPYSPRADAKLALHEGGW